MTEPSASASPGKSGARARVELKDLGDTARRRIEQTAPGRHAVSLLDELDRNYALLAAGAIAFDAFLSLVPLLALAGSALHTFGGEDAVRWLVVQLAPAGTRDLSEQSLLRLVADAGSLAPLSVIAFLWLSSSGIATAMGVCEKMYDAHERGFWRRRALAMVWVLSGILVLVPASAAMVGAIRLLGPRLGSMVALLSAAPVLFAAVLVFFRTAIKRPRGVRRRVVPGALLTVGLWVGVTIAFSQYTTRLARFSLFYGSLAAVAMLLVWLWLLALGLLVGGELNAKLEGVREEPERGDAA